MTHPSRDCHFTASKPGDIKGRKTLRVQNFWLQGNIIRVLAPAGLSTLPKIEKNKIGEIQGTSAPERSCIPQHRGTTALKRSRGIVTGPNPGPFAKLVGKAERHTATKNSAGTFDWKPCLSEKTDQTKSDQNSRIKNEIDKLYVFLKRSSLGAPGQIQVALLSYQYFVVFHLAYSCFTNATR